MLLTKVRPDAVAVITSKSLVCAVTGTARPVRIALRVVPTIIAPVNGGKLREVAAIGVKLLSGVVD